MKGKKEEKITRIVRDGRNTVEAARDATSERATKAFMTLQPILKGEPISEPERIRLIGSVAVDLKQINRYMEAIGARTDPISEIF